MSELKPCPMCDGAAHLTKGYATEDVWPHGEFHRVFCGACQIRQLFHRTASDAVKAWNRRAPVSTPQQSAQRASVETDEFIHLMNLYIDLSTAPNEKFDVTIAHIAWKNLIAHINAWGSAGSGAIPEGWISVKDNLPQPGERVLVARYAGRVANAEHPGYPGKPWIEVSLILKGFTKFLCDLLSTGSVTHWKRDAAPSPAPQGEQA